MAAPKIEDWDVWGMRSRLRDDGSLSHLRLVKRGLVFTFVSGPGDAPWKHFRLRQATVHLWWLEMAVGGGRKREKTPYRDTLDELFLLLKNQFPWMVEPVLGNPVMTSDPMN